MLVLVLVLTMAGEAVVLFDHMRAVALSLVNVPGRIKGRKGMLGFMWQDNFWCTAAPFLHGWGRMLTSSLHVISSTCWH